MATNWRAYGLSQSRGSLPSGPVTIMVHMASVWVPFTSESKEAVAGYPEIQKELRLALQAVGRKLGMYLRRRNRVKHEGQRRRSSSATWAKWPTAVSRINSADREKLYERLLEVAKQRTAEADVQLDDRGRAIDDDDFGDNVLIVAEPARWGHERCPHLGELAALATAILWTVSTLAVTSAGHRVGSLAVSFFRLIIAAVLMMAYGQIVHGLCLPLDASRRVWLASGHFRLLRLLPLRRLPLQGDDPDRAATGVLGLFAHAAAGGRDGLGLPRQDVVRLGSGSPWP